MRNEDKFRIGDRVQLTRELKGWNGFKDGTIVGEYRPNSVGHGGSAEEGLYPVRWDDYNYGGTNIADGHYHQVTPDAIELIVGAPTDDEIQEALSSVRSSQEALSHE